MEIHVNVNVNTSVNINVICCFLAVAYIYRDERRKVEPPMVVMNAAEGLTREISAGRPTAGFGLKWSLNAQEPVVRGHAEMGMKNFDKGYSNKEFYAGQ